MPQTLYDSAFLDKNYVTNYYNVYKFDEDHYLITTDHAAWVVLSKEEYDLLRLERVEEDPNLYRSLKEVGIILTNDNIKDVIKLYAERNHFLFRGPSLHIVVPTLRCNQKCIYCHSSVEPSNAKGYDMDEETAKAIVDFIFKSPTKTLCIEFQGGDCLLNFSIVEFIIDYAKDVAKKKKKKVVFNLVTNLTLMNEDIVKSLSKRKIMGISTSLDGPKHIHDKTRKYLNGRGSYDDVVYWIKRIKDEWKYHFNLNALCTVTKYSLPYVKEMVDEYISLGFNRIFLRPLNNIGFAKKTWNKIGYTPEEYLVFWKEGIEYIIKQNVEGKEIHEFMSVIFLKKILQKYDPLFVDIQSPCGAGIGQLLYTYNGDIHTCDEGKIFPEFKLGNVKTSRYTDIFKNKTLISMIDISSRQNYLCDNCPWNPYCGICPIYTYAAQGSVVSKLSMDDKCKIYKEIIRTLFQKLIFSRDDRKILLEWVKKDTILT
ncbi:MAG: His-Xaa-Ser system radical SAM maturase HxsB [Candidatus Aenigmatarchaeota archaeon]|nr:MAG: His-Xaa-Ser system radical SAM maturase HxsB [Candidatus Aenigmarchaeota archaeon]